MSIDDGHIDRFADIQAAVVHSMRRKPRSLAVIAVDSRGETYYGAHLGSKRDLQEMLYKARRLVEFLEERNGE